MAVRFIPVVLALSLLPLVGTLPSVIANDDGSGDYPYCAVITIDVEEGEVEPNSDCLFPLPLPRIGVDPPGP